jgi:hypothetical protein
MARTLVGDCRVSSRQLRLSLLLRQVRALPPARAGALCLSLDQAARLEAQRVRCEWGKRFGDCQGKRLTC